MRQKCLGVVFILIQKCLGDLRLHFLFFLLRTPCFSFIFSLMIPEWGPWQPSFHISVMVTSRKLGQKQNLVVATWRPSWPRKKVMKEGSLHAGAGTLFEHCDVSRDHVLREDAARLVKLASDVFDSVIPSVPLLQSVQLCLQLLFNRVI